MRKQAFNLGALVSAVAFAALTALWPITHWRSDCAKWGRFTRPFDVRGNFGGRFASIATAKDSIVINLDLPVRDSFGTGAWGILRRDIPNANPFSSLDGHWVGFQFVRQADFICIVLPIWFVMVVTVPLPWLWLHRWRKRPSMAQGFTVLPCQQPT